jgi:hypothetical protein
VYGAVLAGGPVVPRVLREPVVRYALCDGAPLLRELGLNNVHGTPVVVIQPLHGPSMRVEPRCR